MTKQKLPNNPMLRLQAAITATKRTLRPIGKSPDDALGELFRAVQLNRIYPDGKTFVDKVPNAELRRIAQLYETQSHSSDFSLTSFIDEHFASYAESHPDELMAFENQDDPEAHILKLWDVLTRSAPDSVGSLLAMPKPYIVPGGRFGEQYYWDTYFTMLGLEASGRHDLTDGMMANINYMFQKIGFIPTGNRTYYMSRSQPPFFLHMIRLVSIRKGRFRYLLPRLPYLLMEYNYWTKNSRDFLKMSKKAYRRLVKMPNSYALSRYYDGLDTARPESYKEDHDTAVLSGRKNSVVYRHLRAGAESGWDFTSRWLGDDKTLETIETTNIVPLDLNCLLYELELAIAEAYDKMFQIPFALFYRSRAKKRRETINTYMWNAEQGYYFDWHMDKKEATPVWSLAGAYPLYCGVATPEQAQKVAEVLEQRFLQPGGVVTSLHNTGQQWDAPNGWAPLQWITIVGLRRYGYDELADEIKYRWLASNEAMYATKNKFVEKYNVMDPTEVSGGGEYELQDGFGWTNGVFMALRHNYDKKLSTKVPAE